MQGRVAALIGTSVAIQRVREDIACAARSDVKVLITGERGLGKETVCRQIHVDSRRARGPLVTVNCADLPERQLPSVLLRDAKEGTVFLDNIDAMGAHMQTRLLRFLESGDVWCDASDPASTPGDVRVIAASSRNLFECVKTREFREDLYYRLNVLHITMPPLRERREDVAAVVNHFLEVVSRRQGIPMPELSDDTMGALQRYDWPGNVREVRELIEQLAVNGTMGVNDLLRWFPSPSRRMRATP
jgi:transcriptional regulator with PAS, ATPase and Fis domain